METFGCCSHFEKCSENGSCIFRGDINYEGCIYSKNLLGGKNFYSSKEEEKPLKVEADTIKVIEDTIKVDEDTTKIDEDTTEVIERPVAEFSVPATGKMEFPAEKRVFLDCFERNFKIGRRGSTGLSYPLNDEEYQLVSQNLDDSDIPTVSFTQEDKCIMEGDSEEPANSKVVFTLPGSDKEFIIGNFNQCLILKRYSDGIEKALIAKGITARVELMGSYAHKAGYQKNDFLFSAKTKKDKTTAPYKLEKKSDEKMKKNNDEMDIKSEEYSENISELSFDIVHGKVPKKGNSRTMDKSQYRQLSLFDVE